MDAQRLAETARGWVGSATRRAREAVVAVTGSGPDIEEVLADPGLAASLERYAAENDLPLGPVRAEAAEHLHEMVATHNPRATQSWDKLGAWIMRAHDVLVDEEDMARLKALDREHCLAIVFSHRSYLDGWVLPNVMASRRFSPLFTFGGANLDLPVVGGLVSRTGIIFIKRETKEMPVYRLTLRAYISHLVQRRANLAWSIEGGRTRTGKLRPPVHGILRYLSDAAEASDGPDVMLVPVSIVYDQLHEVAGMTAEARGSRKRPEDLGWLIRFARSQGGRLGRAYVSIGEPFPLRQRMATLRAEGNDTSQAVERVAIDASHRINRATPVTTVAVVCLALLGADRALTFERVLDTVEPLARYIRDRRWPVAGAANLTDRSTIRRALQELVASGVLTVFEAGTEPVWRIAPDQHLVAAFYRNTVIHILVDRAIGEVALLDAIAAGEGADVERAAWERAKALRDLLKFEFFFPGRDDFERELRGELALMAPVGAGPLTLDSARALLDGSDLPCQSRAEALRRRLPRGRRSPCGSWGFSGQRGGCSRRGPPCRPAVGARTPDRQRRVSVARAVSHRSAPGPPPWSAGWRRCRHGIPGRIAGGAAGGLPRRTPRRGNAVGHYRPHHSGQQERRGLR
ncbi:MAG: 1-acyl-sn-glycerol-3-phosphate acyltransferase [Actinomycetales bacterium]|uniref:1-acyl-sn-glycerol-3-phosphate acyltransferase n=1 Tax=Candidatus Phosphoribacter hodrii TaxID=2953743 RepID=A0A935IH92_9MICO|nr:1-acyl-sn-glycerol-3-phosphate acyltransferase [Candidatus Phosphoribacter hodrii]